MSRNLTIDKNLENEFLVKRRLRNRLEMDLEDLLSKTSKN